MHISHRLPVAALLSILVLFCPDVKGYAAQPVLQLPIACRPGHDCYIQNYIDHDPSPGWQDYTCGPLSYNGHRGTDFALPTVKMMEEGVNVLAAAPGTVMAIRDGEPDISVRIRGRAALAGKDAGNSVRVRHAGGWETQYSHMKEGSIAVQIGQKVETGMVLGQVGLSGNTEFPHLHFSLRFRGRDIDPFAPKPQQCGTPQSTLWAPSLKTVLKYRPSGLLNVGFSTEIPQRELVDAGAYTAEHFAIDAPSLILWSVIYGIHAQDSIALRLFAPDGQLLHQEQRQATKNQAMLFAYTGKRLTASRWPPGRYTGQIILTRRGSKLIDVTKTLDLKE